MSIACDDYDVKGIQPLLHNLVLEMGSASSPRFKQLCLAFFAVSPIVQQFCTLPCIAESTFDSDKGSTVGLGIEDKDMSSVSTHVQTSTKKFLLKLKAQRKTFDTNKTSGPLKYLIDRERFLGEPVIAKLPISGDISRTNYIVVLHYNIPAVQTTWLPMKYGFVRFQSRMILPYTDDDASEKDFGKVDLLSIYPSNELLDVDHTDKTTQTLHLEPKYMNASGGSFEHQSEKSDSYKFQLPKVIGTATRYGECAWTYYPAKLQPLILGSKTSVAVISVPNRFKTLAIQCTLSYQLKRMGAIPLPFRSLRDSMSFKLADALSVKDLLAIHAIDLPEPIAQKLRGELVGKHTFKVSPASNEGDYFFDEADGKYYRVTKDGSKPVDLQLP